LGLHVVLLDDPVGPHAAHELVLGEDRAARVDEGHECIERSRAELDRPAVGQQLAAMGDDLEPAKIQWLPDVRAAQSSRSNCTAVHRPVRRLVRPNRDSGTSAAGRGEPLRR